MSSSKIDAINGREQSENAKEHNGRILKKTAWETPEYKIELNK